MLSKIKRPLMAAALVLGLGMSVAAASDYCSPCAPVQPRIAVACTSPCLISSSSASAMLPATMTNTPAIAQTNRIAGYSATPTSMVSATYGYQSMPSTNSQITYIVPSMYDTLETTSVPTADNEVERWYAAGNQVVMY